MKKVLSVLLALTMILAMMPTTFAADGDAAAISYDFTSASRNQTSVAYIERHTGSIHASFADYPENDTDAKDQWFVLGNNLNYSGSNSSHPWLRINKDGGHIYTKSGTNVWPSSTVGDTTVGEGWLAFQIYVPTAGVYDLSITAGGSFSDASKSADIYLGKVTDTLNKEYFTSEAVVGTKRALTAGSDKNLYTDVKATAATDRIREGAKKFSELGVPEGYLKASGISLNYAETTEVNLKSQLVAEEAGDYILLLRNNETNTRLTLGYFTLTPAKLDKTHEYIFNRSVLAEDNENNKSLATNDYKMFYAPEGETRLTGNYLDSYDNVDKSLTDEWCVSLLGGTIGLNNSSYRKAMSSLSATGLDMATRKDYANSQNATARFVLQLNVKYDGIYNITAEVKAFAYGTDANVYMIKKSDVTEITPDILKGYKIIGRAGNVAGRPDEDIGAVDLTAGDWYIVFDFNTTNQTQTSSSARQIFELAKLTFTETDSLPETDVIPEATENVAPISFSATTNIPDIAKVTVNGNEGNLAILNPSRGAELSVSAPEVSGYKFIGWKAGTANEAGNGELANTAKFVKDLEQEDIFTVYTSTFLTAVYEELAPADDAAQIVEFWNLDGSYLGQKTVDKIEEEGGLPTTSLIGHTFNGWFTAEDVALDIARIVEKVTHAVASYTADTAVNINYVRVNGEDQETAVAYGTEIECVDINPSKVTHWLRDGKVVSYDQTYKYYVWDMTNIASSYAPIEKKPLVVLDGETVSGAYMIEYDKGNADAIVEVGILFGTGTPTVESKSEIFKSQRGDNHGQFAAKPTDSSYTARGYMIYEENGSYKVIYSE
ncbi:MAG: hypothetical protein IJN09_06680 [Oscillospiraceae bacterium]|nr:hypothetical protein [Oscillospiraceae bacterium]